MVDQAGGIDVSFNLTTRGDVQGTPLLDMSVEDFLRPTERGLRSNVVTGRAAARHMVRCGSGVTLPVQGRMGISFRRDNGKPLLASAFPDVEVILLTNALVIHRPGPIADYIATMVPCWDLGEGSDLPERMYAWLVAEAGRRLAAEGGVWRDPKAVVLFRCRAH